MPNYGIVILKKSDIVVVLTLCIEVYMLNFNINIFLVFDMLMSKFKIDNIIIKYYCRISHGDAHGFAPFFF